MSRQKTFFEIDFDAPPQIGSALMMGAQRYELIEVEDCVRKSGEASFVLHWQSHCPECGETFVAKTGLSGKSPNRRCTEHHAAGIPVARLKKPWGKKYRPEISNLKPAQEASNASC